MSSRMTTNIEDFENINDKTIDYVRIDELLKKHRKVAKEYLQKNLEG